MIQFSVQHCSFECDLAFIKRNVALRSIDFIKMDTYQSRLEEIFQLYARLIWRCPS